MPPLAFLRSLPARLLERVCDGIRGSPGAVRDEEAGGGGSGRSAAGHPVGECYACTQPGVPAFHSTTCDQMHSPDWDADAGSSLVPVQAQQAQATPSASAAQHAGAAARWLFGPVLDPRSKRVQRWNRWILLGRAAALAVDPLFFYALSIGRAGQPCLYMDAGLAAAVTALRTCADVAHLGQVLLQFRLAYVSRESLVVGCGKLVWDARAIAAHYARSLKGLWFDLFVILPLPQMIFWLVIPKLIREEQVKLIMTILLLIFIFQFLPKVYHSIHIMRKMQKVTGYIFGTIWWGFGLNLFAYFIASHIAGGCWYVLAIQRIASCLQEECKKNNSCDLMSLACSKEICFHPPWSSNINGLECDANMTSFSQQNMSTCLSGNGSFAYGIYLGALPVISSNSLAVKILYPIFWGLMTLSCKVSCLHTLSVGSKPMVSLSLAVLPEQGSHLILAMGGLDHKIHIYCGDKSGKFIKACELKGHSDWIRSLDFSLPVMMSSEKHNLFLVSSSQDRTIRIWKMDSEAVSSGSTAQLRKANIEMTSYIEGPLFVAGNTSYQVSLESLLVGHEDWVYSVEWQPPTLLPGDEAHQAMTILSASMDKMMMIWRPEKNTGIWINSVTVGELSHSALGFYGGHWQPGGKSILAHGYGGSFHMWRDVGLDSENWQPQIVPSGHFAPVSDLSWARSGQYLLSVSHDQTTRIFASWRNQVKPGDMIYWREIARPQIHGHDINCVAFIQGSGNHRFVSGADEKVSRIFEAPLSFLKTLQQATLLKPDVSDDFDNVQVLGANMSALGLSQKPIYTHGVKDSPSSNSSDGPDSMETIPDAVPTVFTEPPVEDQLAWNTLWPESHKLYGHGNELFSICCDYEGKLVASSCKAQSAPVAEIWLWEVGTWKAVGRLQSHNLTVTQMEFSRDNVFLLSVSRDRHLSIFSIRKSKEGVEHHLVAKHEAHKRIVWACSWNPFGYEFATGSRDKSVKIWCVQDVSSVKLLATLPQFRDSVTALAWMGRDRASNSGILAVGMDNGLIELWGVSGGRASADSTPDLSPLSAACMLQFDPLLCHVSTVHRLRWREPSSSDEKSALELASCGADHCVRVFNVHCRT